MNQRRITVCFLLVILSISAAFAEQPRYLELTFVTTNDLHAHDVPFTLPADPKTGRPAIPDLGGMARIACIVNKARSETRTPVLLFDSGDTTHGYTALPKAFHGEATIAIMNAMDYEAMAPGNHDFQWHAVDTVRNIKDSEFPWVCANLVYAGTAQTYLPPYVIKEVDGVRVAVFGLINNLIKNHPKTYVAGPELGLDVLPAIETAARLVPELRKKADIVVLLSHLGRTEDVALAQAVPGIDVILGGHSHSTLRTPQMVSVGKRTAFSLGAVPVVQAGYHGLYVGKTRVIFRKDAASGRYTLMSCKGELVTVDNKIPNDHAITEIIKRFEKRIPRPETKPQATPQNVSK